VGILKKFGPESMKREAVLAAIEQYREDKALAGSKSAPDLADCMRVFADHGDTLGTAISYAEHIFAQTGTIQLLTGHKSKGLEFENVYLLDPWLLSDSEQDKNLLYVMQTRSMNSLTSLDSKSNLWSNGMINCIHCAGRSRVVLTRHLHDNNNIHILRTRQCRSCRFKWKTIELKYTGTVKCLSPTLSAVISTVAPSTTPPLPIPKAPVPASAPTKPA
jgi:hypothetical protein